MKNQYSTRFILRTVLIVCVSLILGTLSISGFAQEKHPAHKPAFQENGFNETLKINDRPVFIMLPAPDKRQTPQPWIMYGPTLAGIPDVHEKWMHKQFTDAGIAVAGIDIGEAYGSPDGRKHFSALYRELTKNRGFGAKPVMLGRSRGGLWTSSWAIANPDKVAGLAGIYPVFDLTTYPGVKRAAPAYKMTTDELKASLKKHNPINKARVLAKAKIPVYIIHGDIDKVVPLKENSQTLVNAYKSAGAGELAELNVVEGQGHNYFEGFFRCQELVDFAIKHAKIGAKAKLQTKKKLPAVPESVAVTRDIEYSRPNEQPVLLDLYRPKTIQGKLPVIVWVHGGGWKNGSKERCPAIGMAENGFAVASINYRLTDQAQWPAQINDCRSAVRWLRTNADQYQLNAEKIGAWGSSAGGHLVALMGTLDAPANEKTSSRVQAVCDWFGPSDLLTMPYNVVSEKRTAEQVANSNGAKLLGKPVPSVPELAKQASAIYQVSDDDPPFLIMHGDQDPGVPPTQSQRLHEKLVAAGCSSKLHFVKGAGHGGKEFQTPEIQKMVLEFFKRTLKNQ